jgi:hypothetical protein
MLLYDKIDFSMIDSIVTRPMLQEDICTGWFYDCLFSIDFSIHLVSLLLNKIWCLSTPPIAMESFQDKILISKLYYLSENEDDA